MVARTNSKLAIGIVALVLVATGFWLATYHWGTKVFEDDDCFGEVAAKKRYVLNDSFEEVCKAARQELLRHGGKVYRSNSQIFEGSILLEGMDCAHASLTIKRNKRSAEISLVVFDTDGWHDFQFLKGKPLAP